MSYLPYISCLIITIIQIFFISFLYKKYWRKNTHSTLVLVKVFFYVNLYKLLFNSLIVDILRIHSNGAENKDLGVSGFEIFQVYIIELISNLIYFSAFTFLLIAIHKHKKESKTYNFNKQIKILLLISTLSICNLFFTNYFSKYLWLVKDALYFIGPICSILLLVLGIKYKYRKLILFGLVPLLLTIILNLIQGLRGTIVGISVCFLIVSLIELNHTQFKKVLIIGIFPFLLLSFLQEKLNDIKYAFVVAVSNETIDITSPNSYISFVTDFFNDNLKSEKNNTEKKSIFREIEFRYGAPSMFAVGFLRIASRNEYVYFKPILNSFYSFLPKQLIDDKKPVSGSVDGTEKTMGMYVCYKEITGNDISMTDFYVSSHFYWELGWLGVFLFSFIPAFYNIIIMYFARNWGYFGVSLFILSFKPFWLLSKLWLSEIIIMIPTIIFPAIFIFLVLNILTLNIKHKNIFSN